ncbi:MAG TPA: cellulase family glycosylhydrolase, partial [Polyangia bacterium]
ARMQWPMRGVICALVTLAACAPGKYKATFSPVDSDGQNLRDAEGRVKIYRGVNVHIAGIFDVAFDDGRAPREPLPTFDASDPIDMRARGFNLVRLPINWSAIEPARGQFADDYLDKVAGIVAWCRAAGVDVLIDLHEDGWSKEFCEDGAPLWAIDPPPSTLTGGPVPGPDCHTSAAALAAFDSFWDDADTLEEAYLDMLAHVAGRFAGDPAVIGYEIMNEPIGVDDTVQAFQARAAGTLRATDAAKLIVFEPVATRNFTNGAPIASAPFPVAGAVYAIHEYDGIFSNGDALADGSYVSLLSGSVQGGLEEAQAWGTPFMVTEYGCGSALAQAPAWIGSALDDFDATGASTTWWLWKDPAPGGWGLFDPEADGSYTPRPAMMGALSRPYAQAIGGAAVHVAWDGVTLTVAFRGRSDVPARHDIFWNQGTPAIACDGKPVTAESVDAANSVYVVACGGGGAHTLTFTTQ